MSQKTLIQVMQDADTLTMEEQLELIAHLEENVRLLPAQRKWSDIGPHPMLGEDAQAWVSRTRQEADDARVRS